ncbi:2-hydroxychromene-2-carboxylate isomerase family protein [Glaciecola punicea ACAM 611]|jgi:predicted DsbA family dithiol-disulfide isomerase|uniref:2-hydroxychromene-2-carboxylate isomerase family protein n=1 Tax=Glaciecola punicea ACAM 611 TaxID=1121923 RepID=H5TBR1_9ALTE|nr:DsbA family oxidoreductase [Glaciecola punicea]OFA30904.1 disulfide bond formation protein DsbA [Glaciecola punicea]GAB55738.1 2-hydroxychromene-2-carboxylate isomerase family protein [Glaciecola punicea ACAM 611]
MKQLQIDIVSDVSCPWCIIGYQSLQQALANLSKDLSANITWHPFELNPSMPPQGQEISEHLGQKYGINRAQIEENREAIKQRGVSVGYEFGNRGGGRIYNTFDAHRLLHWAKQENKQTALKLALFDLYFQESGDPSDHQQLLKVATNVGLDTQTAKHILSTDTYAADVRKEQQHFQGLGISSVPAVIVNNKHLISGGQPTDVFENALRKISQEQTA